MGCKGLIEKEREEKVNAAKTTVKQRKVRGGW